MFSVASSWAPLFYLMGYVETIHSRDKENKMENLLKLLWQEEKGQDLTEYALLLALLALGAITSIGTLSKMINNIFANAASNIGTATGP